MTDQTQPPLGTVAEEASRLIAAMATMARSGAPTDDSTPDPTDDSRPGPSPYAGEPAQPSASPDAGPARAQRPCSACGGDSDGTPVACKLCPLCQGIALLRSIRPETVDRLADLAQAMAASLRDVATQSRASGSSSDARSSSGRPSDRGRATVQDIPVDDENEGWRS